MTTETSRRRFLGGAAALSATTALTGSATARERDPDEPFRIGALNVYAYSHLIGLWGRIINPRKGQQDVPFSNMRITHCWDIEDDRAQEFANLYGCEVVKNHDDMLGKVDGVISGGFYNNPWNHIIHEPYLEAGLPNLINRPFANSLEKADRMLELSRRTGAPILCPSSHEHNEAIVRAKQWATGKHITSYNATNSFDDYPTHGIHGVYMMHKAVAEAGNPVVSVGYRAASWHSPSGVLTYEHQDAGGRRFYGTLHQSVGGWGTVHIHTPEDYGGKDFLIRCGSGYPFDQTEVWAPTIWAYQRMAQFGEMPQTLEQIHDKTAVFLAGFHSFVERDGAPVAVADLPPDWQCPVELPNHPDHDTVARFTKRFGTQ